LLLVLEAPFALLMIGPRANVGRVPFEKATHKHVRRHGTLRDQLVQS